MTCPITGLNHICGETIDGEKRRIIVNDLTTVKSRLRRLHTDIIKATHAVNTRGRTSEQADARIERTMRWLLEGMTGQKVTEEDVMEVARL